MPKKRVFISSRINEVREFREAAVKAIEEAGMEPIYFDSTDPEKRWPLKPGVFGHTPAFGRSEDVGCVSGPLRRYSEHKLDSGGLYETQHGAGIRNGAINGYAMLLLCRSARCRNRPGHGPVSDTAHAEGRRIPEHTDRTLWRFAFEIARVQAARLH